MRSPCKRVHLLYLSLTLLTLLLVYYRGVLYSVLLVQVRPPTEHSRNHQTTDSRTRGLAITPNNGISDDPGIKTDISKCFIDSGLAGDDSLISKAQSNAVLYYSEYRKVIPSQSLQDNDNHCWRAEYNIKLGPLNNQVSGSIGALYFNDTLPDQWYTETPLDKLKGLPHTSSTACVPNIYILGVPKCGTTFLWCFMNKLLNNGGGGYEKEPHFWTPYEYTHYPPEAGRIASRYLLNYISDPGVQNNNIFIDGSPNTVLEWPKFSQTEADMTNYCLLPVTMPRLLPKARFIVILRNPIKALYSAFWWSLNFMTPKNASQAIRNKYKGPGMFHDRISVKISRFNKCLTDSDHPIPCSIGKDYSDCVGNRFHLLASCVAEITVHREPYQTALHKFIYYPHVLKWLSTVPKDRLLIISLEKLLANPLKMAKKLIDFAQPNNPVVMSQDSVGSVVESCGSNPQLIVDYKHNSRLAMREDTVELLKTFFQPFNKELFKLLNDEQFMWS